jgi:hypothetical protein
MARQKTCDYLVGFFWLVCTYTVYQKSIGREELLRVVQNGLLKYGQGEEIRRGLPPFNVGVAT